jgi:hypothetical protein
MLPTARIRKSRKWYEDEQHQQEQKQQSHREVLTKKVYCYNTTRVLVVQMFYLFSYKRL